MDVDKALAEILPEQFDEWMMMNDIVPFGDEKLCWVMAVGFSAVCNLIKSFGENHGKDMEPRDFIYWSKRNRKSKPKYTNPNQAAMMFKMAVGNRG